MKVALFGLALSMALGNPMALSAQEGLDDEIALPAPATGQAAGQAPATYRTGDGHVLTIQREWSDEKDPTSFGSVPLEGQPFRFDQRQPQIVYTEPRAGHQPLYYFNDVRWRQEDRPEGAKFGRRAYWTTVRVDLEKVKGAWFCLKPFAPKFVAGHAAILLEFEPGGFQNLDGQEAAGFVLSYEAYLRASQKYGLIGGQFAKKFRVIYVTSTWRDFLVRSIRFNNSIVKRWKLDLTPDQLRDLTVAVGKISLADHSQERYNTTRHSCVTAALELLMSILPPQKRSSEKWLFGLIQNPGWALPVLADQVLKNCGLIKSAKETITQVPADDSGVSVAPAGVPGHGVPPPGVVDVPQVEAPRER